MDKGTKNKIKDNINKILMIKAVKKVQEIIEKEKQQKKSDKLHVTLIVIAFVVSLLITIAIFSIIKV